MEVLSTDNNLIVRSKFSYEMLFGRNEDEMVEAIKKIILDKTLMPVLMFLYKDKETDNMPDE